jgi:hypothetical protein
MVMFICDICKKEFKTNQHLHQHKSRKKACVNDNSVSDMTTVNNENKNINDYNINNLILHDDKNNMSYNDIITFLITYKNIQAFIKDKNEINELREEKEKLREENEKFKKQLEVINNIIKNETNGVPSSKPTYPYCEPIGKPSCQPTLELTSNQINPSCQLTEKKCVSPQGKKLVAPIRRTKTVTPT